MGNIHINLIHGEGGRLAGITRLEDMLRKIAWISLIVIFVTSLGVGFSYFFMSRSLKAFEANNERLTQGIHEQSLKEGLLLSLVDRTRIASRALSAAKPWGKLFTLLTQAAPEVSYRSVSVDDTATVTSIIELSTIDEAVMIVTNIISLAHDRLLRSPQLQSFSMQETGKIQMTVSFYPVL